MQQTERECLSPDTKNKLDKILDTHNRKDELIMILNETQEALGYVPYEAQKYIAEAIGVPLAEIYGIVTFYSRFSLKPVGKYKVSVCLGTACYVKSSQLVLEKVEERLGIKAGETSADGQFSIAATRCVGACGLAPIMTVNEDVYGKVVPEDIEKILGSYN